MIESLRLFIADMITLGKQQHSGWAEQSAVDVLLTLAGHGLASTTKDQSGNWNWCANPTLIDDYQMGGGTGKPKLILDEALEDMLRAVKTWVQMQAGCREPKPMKRISAIISLIGNELNGVAVEYKDPKGRLVWKGSFE
jgi:hypothetical protein